MDVPQNQLAAAAEFKELHEKDTLFVMPCAWDAFSAMVFERAGFSCLGTTSGGVNWVKGRKDYVYSTPSSEMLSAYGEIAAATRLPVSGDLENGYGDDIDSVVDTIIGSIKQGMVGGSIEDQGVVPSDEQFNDGVLLDFDLSVERIRAARYAADELGFPYVLTARCEVYFTGHPKPYDEAVRRLNAYAEAGANCLFVPGLNKLDQLAQLVRDVIGPVSFGMGAAEEPLTLPMLEGVGIRRISTGGGIARATFGLIDSIGRQIASTGRFDYLEQALSEADVVRIIERT